MTVGDVSRAIEGVRRDEKNAIEFMRAFSHHPDVLWRIPAKDAVTDARARAEYQEEFCGSTRARVVSTTPRSASRTAYVDGVLRKYADSV